MNIHAQCLTLAFAGDLMLGRQVDAAAATRPPEDFWGDLLPFMRGADAVLANLECPITESVEQWRRCRKTFRFRANPRVVDLMTVANVRFVSLANNHILDYEAEGLLDTLRHLDAAGISHAGAGRCSRDALEPALFEAGGTRIGVIALTDNMPEFAAGRTRPGTNYLRIRPDHATLSLIELLVRDLRRAGAEVVIVSAHWGPNLRPWPPRRFREFARAVVDAGVSVFHGHSAHLLQGIERHGDGFILYDTGDLLDDYWVFPFVRTDRSCLFFVEFANGKPRGVRLVPLSLRPTRVQRALGGEGRAIVSQMLRRCRPFLSNVSAASTELLISCADNVPAPAQEEPFSFRSQHVWQRLPATAG
jgi:poly-gamma-glutamate synthesis protein (capsule biosynthesis protein)